MIRRPPMAGASSEHVLGPGPIIHRLVQEARGRGTPQHRRSVIEKLRGLQRPEICGLAVELLRDSEITVRVGAVGLLSDYADDTRVIAALREAAAEPLLSKVANEALARAQQPHRPPLSDPRGKLADELRRPPWTRLGLNLMMMVWQVSWPYVFWRLRGIRLGLAYLALVILLGCVSAALREFGAPWIVWPVVFIPVSVAAFAHANVLLTRVTRELAWQEADFFGGSDASMDSLLRRAIILARTLREPRSAGATIRQALHLEGAGPGLLLDTADAAWLVDLRDEAAALIDRVEATATNERTRADAIATRRRLRLDRPTAAPTNMNGRGHR